MLTNHEYFYKGRLVISNINPNITTEEGNYTEVNEGINDYEPEICEMLMGKVLYDALITGLAVTPTPDTRWTALAAELRDSTAKTSPVASYIWFKLWERNGFANTRFGDIVRGDTIEPNNAKACDIWNAAVKQYIVFQDWLQTNIATYPEYDGVNVYYFSSDDNINVFGI